MNANEVIILARKHLCGANSRICLEDAINLQAEGKLEDAKRRALKSLMYSVGAFHPDYIRAAEPVQVAECSICGAQMSNWNCPSCDAP